MFRFFFLKLTSLPYRTLVMIEGHPSLDIAEIVTFPIFLMLLVSLKDGVWAAACAI